MALIFCPQSGLKGLSPRQRTPACERASYSKELMPKLGQIKKASEIGYKGNAKYIWTACPECHKERWVSIYALPYSKYKGRCINCWIHRSRLGESGKIHSGGYIKVKLQANDFFDPMADKKGYVLEHRLVMAKHLGRCLHSWEIVHHKDGTPKDDNRVEGLQLVTDERHNQITIMETKIKRLEERITLLKAENAALKAQLINN